MAGRLVNTGTRPFHMTTQNSPAAGRETTRNDMSQPDYDVAIIGGGMAGLAAAWRMRGRRCVVLEAGDRPGGRVHSLLSESTPLNLGAHMVGGPGSIVGELVAQTSLPTRKLPERLFGLQYAGRRHLGGSPSLLPLTMRLSPMERLAFMRLGLTLRLGAWRSTRAGGPDGNGLAHRESLFAFEGDRTLREAIGPMPERMEEILRGLTERNGADPTEMSAGHAFRSFANVWAKTAPGSNLVGGTAALPEALARGLGDAFRPGHKVTLVRRVADDRVEVAFETAAGPDSITARACILAAPAFVAKAIAPDLAARTRDALANIRYGAFLSVGVRLDRAARIPWRDTYAVATPDLGFSVLFNHDRMRPDEGEDSDHAVMLFAGAARASRWIAAGEAATLDRWIADLETHFPETRGHVRDATFMAWSAGAPFAFPGRALLQADLEMDDPPFALAGDYLEFPNMDAAAGAGYRAAERVEGWLAG
ncbi:MAG: FAD-binding protein [Salinarimonadaceae bacterium]|nr:MAG: FAD-binding protein [Salinarimonadaceae bacterium]